jgi:hypothetical protein
VLDRAAELTNDVPNLDSPIITQLGQFVDSAATATPLASFRVAWRTATGQPLPERFASRARSLGEAAAANDVAEVGRLLMGFSAGAVQFWDLPDDIARKPRPCALIDAAAGAESVEVMKYLLEFHNAEVTRETLKMAISTGNAELIKMVTGRLAADVLEHKFDLLEIAAEFHRDEPFAWLFRDASPLEKEAIVEFALERHLADAVLIAVSTGYRIWSWCSIGLTATWAPASGLESGPSPESIDATSGWWTRSTGLVGVLPNKSGRCLYNYFGDPNVTRVILPNGITKVEQSACRALSGLVRIAIPKTVKSIGACALAGCASLGFVEIPAGKVTISDGVFDRCAGLKRLAIPDGVTSIGGFAVRGCTRLTHVTIPGTVTRIGSGAFAGCSALKSIVIPADVSDICGDAFAGVADLTQLELTGSVIASAIATALTPCLTAGTNVVGAELRGQNFCGLRVAGV